MIQFARWLSKPFWTATCDHAGGFLADQRRKGRAVTTRAGKAGAVASFFEVVMAQPIDEFNRGKGSRGRGPKARLVPAINGVDQLMDWWLAEVRHLFSDDWSDPDAPLLPSERPCWTVTQRSC